MRSEAVRQREERERATFSKVADERSFVGHAELRIQREEIERYRRFADGRQQPLYSIERVFALTAPRGKRVLEICGHHAENGALLAHLGGEVDSVDIAEPLVELARRRIDADGLHGKLRAHVMSVHEMEFPDATFDVVFGKAALHHLDLELARREIFRVLKPGGYAVFGEPVQLLPGMRRIRGLIPIARDAESPDEKPLDAADLAEFCRPFERVETYPYRLLARLDRVLGKEREELLSRIDAALFRRFRALGPFAGIVVFRVFKPG